MFPNLEWKGLIISICSLLFTLFVVEQYLHFFFPQIQQYSEMFQPDNDLGWTFVPNKSGSIVFYGEVNHYIKTNSLGFRDKTFESNQKAKILVIGDSFVSNISVPQDSVFTEIIEAKFDSTIVVNCGVNGYGTLQSYLLLEQLIDKIQPDLLIHQVFLGNDFTDNISYQWIYPRPVIDVNVPDSLSIIHKASLSKEKKRGIRHYLSRHSHLYEFVKRRVKNVLGKTVSTADLINTLRPSELEYCSREKTDKFKIQFKILIQLLEQIKVTASQNQTDVIFTIAPSIFQIEDEYWNILHEEYPAYGDQLVRNIISGELMQAAQDHGLTMIDLFPVLREASLQRQSSYFYNEQHWTSYGNKIVAEKIYAHLQEHYSFQ